MWTFVFVAHRTFWNYVMMCSLFHLNYNEITTKCTSFPLCRS